MSNRGEIRSQVYSLLRQTSGDSHFEDPELNLFIDQAQSLIAPIIEYPRKQSTGTQVSQGNGNVTLPSDNLIILSAYFGDVNTSGDVGPLTVIKEEILKELAPSWMDETTNAQGRPRYFMERDIATGFLFPRANAAESATGKKVYFTYVYNPPAITSDSTTPPFPTPYTDIMKFYVCYLCYLNMSNQEMAAQMLKDFRDHHEAIKSAALRETREGLAWQWGFREN